LEYYKRTPLIEDPNGGLVGGPRIFIGVSNEKLGFSIKNLRVYNENLGS